MFLSDICRAAGQSRAVYRAVWYQLIYLPSFVRRDGIGAWGDMRAVSGINHCIKRIRGLTWLLVLVSCILAWCCWPTDRCLILCFREFKVSLPTRCIHSGDPSHTMNLLFQIFQLFWLHILCFLLFAWQWIVSSRVTWWFEFCFPAAWGTQNNHF